MVERPQGIGDIGSWLKNAAGDVLKGVTNITDPINEYVIKPAVREGMAASIDASSLLTWSLGTAFDTANPKHFGRTTQGKAGQSRGEFLDEFKGQFITGQRDGLQGLGTGFLPGGEAYAKSQEGIQEARPRIGSHAFTLGRTGAYPGVALGIYPEDGIIHKIISGGIDAFVIMKNPLDPFNSIPRIKAGGTGAESMVSTGKTRIVDAQEFGKYFNDLEERALGLMDDIGKPNPTGAGRTAEDLAVLDEYNRLIQPLTPTRTRPFPENSPNWDRLANTYDPSDVYNHWKSQLDDAFGDLANDAGAIRDNAPSMIRNQYTTWRESGKGTEWATKMLEGVRSGELDLQTLWKSPMFGREGLGTANRLATELLDPNATTETVFKILDEAASSFDPLVNVRNVGASQTDLWRTGAGINIKTASQRNGWRQLEVLPESLKVGKSDPAQSARNLDDLMGTFNFDFAERGQWLSRFAKDIQGTKDDLFNFLSDFSEHGVRSRLAAQTVLGTNTAVFTDDEIRVMSSWTQKLADELVNWTKNDLGQVVPLPWIDNAGSGIAPLRNSQLLASDQFLISPAFIDDVIQATGKIGAFVKAGEGVPYLGKGISAAELTSDVIKQYMSRIWKPSRVAKPSHLLRVAPEETIRALASGIFEHPMEQMLAILGRTMKSDAAGNTVAGKIPNFIKMNKKLSALEMDLLEANSYVKQANFTTNRIADLEAFEQFGGLTAKQQKLVDRIPEIKASIVDIEAKLAAEPQPIWDSLIGPNSRGAKATAIGEWVPDKQNMLRSGSMQLPDRTIPAQRGAWVKGLVHELSSMADNPDYARIAAAQLDPDDLITVGNKTATIAEHVAEGTVHPFTGQKLGNNLDAIKLWLFQGGGRKQFEGYFENVANLKPEYQNGGWDNYGVASGKVQLMLDDIISKTGGDPILNQIISTKKYDDVRAVVRNMHTGRGEASKPLRDYLSKTFINQPHAPRMVEFYPENLPTTGGAAGNLLSHGLDKLFNFYFEDMYGRTSDAMSRVPVWKAGYWTRMEELASHLQPLEAKKLLVAAEKAGLTESRLERIQIQAALANGKGTIAGAELLAESYARRFSKDLLFDASKRTLFGKQHSLLFPFFEAFREVTGTWLKLAAKNPRIIRNTAQFAQTSQEEGWFYTDDNGRKVFEVPMTGAVARIFAGNDSTVIKNFTVGVNAVNIAGQMRPGIGPVLQVSADVMLPKNADYDWMREMISPFGDPNTESFELQSLWAPKYLKQLFAETQGGDGFWTALSKAVIGDTKKDDYFQRSFTRIMQHNANTNEANYQGADGMKRLYADSEAQALRLTTLRGLTAFAGPGAPMTTWMAHTKHGVVEVGILADDLYVRETAAVKRGEPRYKGFEGWLNFWGEQVWPYVSSLTTSNVGGQIATEEFERWARKNTGLLKEYPLLGGYLGPRDGIRNFDAWAAQMDAGRRTLVDPAISTANAQNRLGKELFRSFKEQFTAEDLKTTGTKQSIADKTIEIEKRLPGWGRPGSTVGQFASKIRDDIKELRLMIADPKASKLPIVQAVATYLTNRDAAILTAIKGNPAITQTNWMTVKSGYELRVYLATQLAPFVASQTPAFQDLYDQVLSYEFDAIES
jgi:hypothetical protein